MLNEKLSNNKTASNLHHQLHHDHRYHQESTNDTVWHPRKDLTEDQVFELHNKLEFVKEGIVKVNMMILTCSVLWKSCTWNKHQQSMDAMLECARIHFLEVTSVFLEYLKLAYYDCPPCIATGVVFDEEPVTCEV